MNVIYEIRNYSITYVNITLQLPNKILVEAICIMKEIITSFVNSLLVSLKMAFNSNTIQKLPNTQTYPTKHPCLSCNIVCGQHIQWERKMPFLSIKPLNRCMSTRQIAWQGRIDPGGLCRVK